MWFAMSFKVFLSQKFSRNFPTVNSYCVVRSGKNISIEYIFVIRQPLLQQLSYIPNILQDFLKISFGWYTQLLSWVRYPKEIIVFFFDQNVMEQIAYNALHQETLMGHVLRSCWHVLTQHHCFDLRRI